MKTLIFIATIFLLLQNVIAQVAPVGYIPEFHRADWHLSGVNENNPPALPDFVEDLDARMIANGTNLKDELDAIVTLARGRDGITLVLFGAGTYTFDASTGFDEAIVIGPPPAPTPPRTTPYDNSIIFQGVGESTLIRNKIANALGHPQSAFVVRGSVNTTTESTLTTGTSFGKGTYVLALDDVTGFSEGDWVQIEVENFHLVTQQAGSEAEDWIEVGQIAKIRTIDTYASTITLWEPAHMTYTPTFGIGGIATTVVKLLNHVSGVGFENFMIAGIHNKKAEDGDFRGYHFDFEYAVNCWVRGVTSVRPPRAHIDLEHSARIEVSGCYLLGAVHRGSGGYGYGVILQKGTSNCRIENNIFQILRHGILFQAGASGNVAAFNYIREGNWTHSNTIAHDPRDIVFHGGYPFSNLVEHNMTKKMGPDTWNGRNGPYNAIVRNRVKTSRDFAFLDVSAIKVENITYLNLLGNVIYEDTDYYDIHPTTIFLNLYGIKNGIQEDHDDKNYLDWALYFMDDVSYAYSAQPDFAVGYYTWPAIGPTSSNGISINRIPANDRFHDNSLVKTYNSKTTPSPVPGIMVANSFEGGTIKINSVTENSGQIFNWTIGSSQTIEAYDQDYPQTGNFERKFSKWTTPDGDVVTTPQLTLTTPNFNGAYTADFLTRLDVDLDKNLLNGGSGGIILLHDSVLTTYPYSAQHYFSSHVVLEVENFTETVNSIPVDYSLAYWSNGSFDNPLTLEADDHIDLTATLKGNKVANSENATYGSNGNKIAANPINGDLHMVYIDNGELYYSTSTDGGINWTQDAYLDGNSSSYICQYPSLGVDRQGNVHIAYEREFELNDIKEYTVQYIEIDNLNETGIIQTELGNISNNYGGYQNSTMPSICVEYYGDVYVVWRRSFNNLWFTTSNLVVKHKDGYGTGNWSSFKDIPNTDINCKTPTLSYGSINGAGYLHVFWVNTQSDKVYYANPSSQWNWGTNVDLTSAILTIDDFKNTSVHQSTGGYPDEIYLVWEGIEEFAGETKSGKTKNKKEVKNAVEIKPEKNLSAGCPPASSDNPVIYFQEKGSSGWTGQTFFRINNTCDRKPVVTSWETSTGRQVMIAYESIQGRISTILRNENGQWATPIQVTSNGSNPALTNPEDSEPNMIYTRHSTNPHEILFNGNLLPPPSAPGATNTSLTTLPHSRIVQFGLDKDLLGGSGLGIKGNISFEIGDLELMTPRGSQKISPVFNDSLITPNNVFEYNKLVVSEETTTLKIPISIRAPYLSHNSDRESTPLPLFNLQLHDVVTHSVIKNIKYYDTSILASKTFYQEQDTIEVNLNDLSSSNLYVRGEVYLNEDKWKIDMAEVFDLRNIEPDTLQKDSTPADETNIPKKFALYQNYPNPFNPSTTIKFDLPKPTNVKIKIYDIQGRLVNVLVDEKMVAGSHEAIWDGRSRGNYNVSSGVYFYRIQASGFTKVKKMLVVK
ncbi:MAG: T9SS type A sorting domain-containing protein [Calditrichia bacterium]